MADTEQQIQAVKQIVVLAGATVRKQALEQLANELGRRGLQVELAIGIERGMVALLQVSFRNRGKAVYLLCGGPELQAPALEKMTLAVKSNGAPAHCVWAGPLDWASPSVVLRSAEHRLAALGCDLGPVLAMPTQTAPPPQVSAPPPVPARTSTMVSSSAPLVPHTPRPRPGPSANVPIVGAATADELHDVDSPLEIPRGAISRFATSRLGIGVVGGVAAVLIAGVVWSATSGGDEKTPDAGAQPSAGSALASADGAASVSSPEPAAQVPSARSGVGVPAEEQVALVPEAVPSVDAAPPQEESEPEVEVEPAAAEGSARLAADTNTPAQDAELVYAALEQQSIRAIDILLVSATATKQRGRRSSIARMRFDDAEAHCQELVVDGVGGWRLPDVGEAGWLTRANIIKEGTYWTSTKADAFGAERVVWNVHGRRMGSTHTRWKGGRVVCVRLHRPDDGAE